MYDILFLLISAACVVFAACIVFSKSLYAQIFSLVLFLSAVGAVYIMCGDYFLACVQFVCGTGLVFIVFIMVPYLLPQNSAMKRMNEQLVPAAVLVLILCAIMIIINADAGAFSVELPPFRAADLRSIAGELFSNYILAVLFFGVALLSTAAGLSVLFISKGE